MTDASKFDFSKFMRFLKDDIWRIRASTLSGHKSFWIRQLRIILLAFRGFAEDKCKLQASALTFYSLMSVVPVVAMAFGIAKGFGFEKRLVIQIRSALAGQEEVANRILEFTQALLSNTQGGWIAGIGVAVLFWSVIGVLGNIENSFNGIWGIKKGRTMGRKFSDYLSIMMICPVLFIMSSSVTVMITSQVTLLVERLAFLGPVGSLIITSLKILPYAVIWIMFTFTYIFMPNTKVNFKSGLIAGIIAGTIFQFFQWVYITFQLGVSKYGAIYGSFAALPLFLMWLQISWLVVLFGAEISFAEQNVDTYEFESDSLKASNAFKKLLALNITHLCVRNFHDVQKPQTASEFSHQLEIPIRLVNQILFELTEAGVLSEIRQGPHTVAYQPARDIDDLTIHNVLELLDSRGIDNIPVAQTESLKKIKERVSAFNKILSNSQENILLLDLDGTL